MTHREEDLVLIEKYLAGNEDAIEELVLKYQRQIYAVLYRMICDMEEAKDLTQKTFIKAIKGVKGFRKEASFKTWLYQIAINTGLNHIKKKKEVAIELDESNIDPELISRQRGVLSEILEREKRDCIKKSLSDLPERQRLAITLRVYDGLSCNETAKVMKCSEGAVKAHYHQAVKKLREILKGYNL